MFTRCRQMLVNVSKQQAAVPHQKFIHFVMFYKLYEVQSLKQHQIFKFYFTFISEGVVSYSIPQGMVRGASLELMDHTFDGIEDSQTGDLRGGLGQLVDGKYGWDNFKATSPGGQIKGEQNFLPVLSIEK